MRIFVRNLSVLLALALGLGIAAARAEEPVEGQATGIDHAVPTVSQALEISAGGGYLQGTGDISNGMNGISDLSGPGGSLELQVGYRMVPEFAFGVYGTFAQFGKGDKLAENTKVRSATAGIYADYHFRPTRSMDPFVGLSSGWRGLWLVPDVGNSVSMQGLELARLRVGLDYRITPEIAIAPVISAGASMFLTQDVGTSDGFVNIPSPNVNFFFFGGLLGRFDLMGKTSAERVVAEGQPAIQVR